MQYFILLISALLLLATFVHSRDADINDESLETERLHYCPRREKWMKCGTGCERSCTNPRPKKPCNRPCIPHLCTCKRGFYRDNQGTGRCVRLGDCKKW